MRAPYRKGELGVPGHSVFVNSLVGHSRGRADRGRPSCPRVSSNRSVDEQALGAGLSGLIDRRRQGDTLPFGLSEHRWALAKLLQPHRNDFWIYSPAAGPGGFQQIRVCERDAYDFARLSW